MQNVKNLLTKVKQVWTGIFSHRSAWLVGGVLLGALVILGIRFATYKPASHVHYHANFAVYINGVREEFKDPSYYEDVLACAPTGNDITPPERAHMHDNVNNVVHIHDHAVTWGQFFTNIGWYIGDDFIKTRTTMYTASGNSELHIMLNNQDYTGLTPVTNMLIKDQDMLLVSFGDIDNATLQQEYKTIPHTAHSYDVGKDPASCSAGGSSVTTGDRFKHLF
ncbi:MAG TPA: hypothetical protein VLG16_05310 [Candidatus Saccharimonadales bacterium]|nr:hypothetical protein [Candidatus Saccharimonadales bacterium]